MALGVQWADVTMDHNVIDHLGPTLQRIQAELAAIRARLDGLETKMEAGFARVDERFELVNGRFGTLENAIVDLSARVHVLGRTHDREINDVRARLTSLETREPE
jgi:hypothetical protein